MSPKDPMIAVLAVTASSPLSSASLLDAVARSVPPVHLHSMRGLIMMW